jgi:hypothetical protein
VVRIQKPKKGHKPNMAQRRKRERHRAEGRLAKNKSRRIRRMLLDTHNVVYKGFLERRLKYWTYG